jgi:hypothetical protein
MMRRAKSLPLKRMLRQPPLLSGPLLLRHAMIRNRLRQLLRARILFQSLRLRWMVMPLLQRPSLNRVSFR